MGYSVTHQEVAVIFLQHARTTKWMLPGGFVDSADETPAHAAAREMYEELRGMQGDVAVANAVQLCETALAAELWSGPYGTPPFLPHAAFVLITDGNVLPTLDQLVSDFVPNRECSAIALVATTAVRGNALQLTSLDSGDLQFVCISTKMS